MVLARFVLLAAFLLAASSVNAAVTIDLGPSDYRSFGPNGAHTTGGIRSSFGQTVRMPPSSGSLTVTRNPVIPYGSIANGLRNFTRINPASVAASAAVTGLFLAVDWVFDQSTGEWMKEDVFYYDDLDFNLWCVQSYCGPSPESVCDGYVSSILGPGRSTSVVIQTSTSALCYQQGSAFVTLTRSGECPVGYSYESATGRCTSGTQLIELDESDWSELAGYLPSADPQTVADAAADTQRKIGDPLPGYQDQTITGPSSVAGPETTSTSTDPVTGDTIVTTTNTTTNITYGDTTITTTNTTVTNTYTNGNHTSTETTTETPGELPVTEPTPGGAAGEWPGFCDWASVVCSFIEWFQEPFDAPEVEWPLIEDQDYEEEFDFTLAASCPEPYTIELALFPPVQFNWQPFCDLATFIRPLVLASAAIFAAFISLGIARARN